VSGPRVIGILVAAVIWSCWPGRAAAQDTVAVLAGTVRDSADRGVAVGIAVVGDGRTRGEGLSCSPSVKTHLERVILPV